MTRLQRRLVLLPRPFSIDHIAGSTADLGDDWVAVVRSPEGVTVIRQADAGGRWVGFYGDDAHDLDAPGMLVAVLGPLARGEIPVFVASTFHSDLVLVPEERIDQARALLEAAGHSVQRGD
jgi:hypothetical protein